MTVTYVLLAVLCGAASVMCVWALLTGGPGQDVNKLEPRSVLRHSRKARGEVTQRIRPAAPELFPPSPDGGRAQALPRREDLPWNQ